MFGRLIENYKSAARWTMANPGIDDDFSGAKRVEERPGLMDVISRLRKGVSSW